MQELNEAQLRAVTHFEGPMLVLAGPGSGKTRVITERIGCLTQERGVNPANILVITFTKAAAMEMRQRYQRIHCNRGGGVHFGTFHAIFFMILKYSYHYSAENIIRDDIRRELLRRFLHETDLEIQDENEFVGALEGEISRIKGDRLDLANYFSPLCSNEVFQEIYIKYNDELKKRRLIDFDDMLVHCYELLQREPEVLKMWQEQFQYILIDEFQDICRVQYDIVRMLAVPRNNLFIVGDDDQSIYGFRGARPDIMKQFLRDYPAKRELLGINYRCAAPIVKAAGRVIAHNKNRLPKEIRPACAENMEYDRCSGNAVIDGGSGRSIAATDEGSGRNIAGKEGGRIHIQTTPDIGGGCVTVNLFTDLHEESGAICRKLLDYHKLGVPYHEMAVLFRTNTQAMTLSARLMEHNIPFSMKERLPNLYEHWIAQDVLAYIRIAQGDSERSSVLRIINKPKRYIQHSIFTEPVVDFEELKGFYEDKPWMVERIEKLQYDISFLAKMRPYAAVNYIRRGIGYDEFISEYADYRGISADAMYEVLEQLQEAAQGKQSFDAWFEDIRSYQEELEKQAHGRRGAAQEDGQQEAVMLMTMHGAKGLEFECVFIPDANEGVTPHSKSVLNADMEEERRMFYVAMTRAKSYLHICCLKERFNKETDVSRFVEELLEC